MSEVSWGSENTKFEYIDLLRSKVVLGWVLTLFFGLGGGALIFSAMTPADNWEFLCGVLIWIVVVLAIAARLSWTNRRIRSLEIFLGFYDRRHQVRHQLFCSNHLHCLALHYFRKTD